jgi:hypothetical protein
MRKPLHPYVVLALAVALPGMGHVAVGQAPRGLVFAFFTLLFIVLTHLISTPDQSVIARSAGGLFVRALSIPDAYRLARIRHLRWMERRPTA